MLGDGINLASEYVNMPKMGLILLCFIGEIVEKKYGVQFHNQLYIRKLRSKWGEWSLN